MAVLIGPRFARNGLQFESCYHVADSSSSHQSGLYLGYLRGRSFPPPKKKNALQKMLLSLWYLGKYIRKIIQTGQGYCTNCNISHYCVSKCTRLYLRAYSFQNTSRGEGGGCLPPDPPWKLVAFAHLGLLPQKINPR